MMASVCDDKNLNRECSVFSIYLIGEPSNEYVKRKYREAHQSGLFFGAATQPAENFLVRVASVGPWSTKIIDGYTRIFRPFSLVRKKLVLLLAILECSARTHEYLESADSRSISVLLLQLVTRCLTFVLIVVLAIFFILPVEVILRGKAKPVAF